MEGKMKKVSLMIVAIIVVCILSTAIFTACSGTGGGPSGPTGPKQVPIYQGMEISGSMPSYAASAMAAGDHQEDNNKDGHKHGPGCTHGNGEDRDEDLDEDDPFEEDVPTMEEVAESTLQVVGAEKDIYYADQNETIYITIKIDNPDSFEILSFTLNGQKYSNYMFEDGSDLEHLILKLNVGNAEGIVDYTIDAIKYVDGTEIKDVRMEGDKTVKAGVRRDNLLVTTVTNEDATMTSISFDVSITDTTALIEKSGGYAKAVLYDGVNFVSQDIVIGETQAVQFENLTPNTVYQYGVVALYDDLSGVGPDLNVLYKNAVYTDTIVLFKDLVVEQERFQWDYLWHETITDGTITALELFKDGQKIQDLDPTAKEVTGLLTSNAYTIVATYKNLDGADETIYMDFITLAKATPVVTIEGADLTQTSVGFDIIITDTDAVGEITSIALLHGEDEPALADSLDAKAFENLLSNNEYVVRVTYTYDLNDGVGEQTVVAEYAFTTLAKAMPSATISNLTSTQNTIECDVAYTDVDSVGSVVEIALYELENKIKSAPFATHVSFDGLESGKEYKVVVEYKYDLNDGKGEITANVDAKYSTLVDKIVVDNLTLLNNNVVKLGEEINLRVYFANEAEIELTGIYVNGQKATVVGGDRIESAIVKFVPTTSGLCRFAIDRVDYVINGIEVNQTIDSSVEVEYPIYKDLNITYTPITISKYENTGDGVYLSFDNEDGYTVFKVNERDDFVTVDSGRIFTKAISITSIEYGYADYGHTTQSCDFRNDYWIDSIHNVTALKRIYTVEDFFAMTDGYYLLMNDLDLRSVQTKAQINLTGIFDANGHTIRGLSNVVDTSKYGYFDLFQGGSIYDATFKELYVSVDHTNSADYLYVRPLGRAKLYNCTVKGDVVLSDFVDYGDLNIVDDSTTYSLNVTIGTTMSTQKHTAANTIAKNAHIVERDDVFYFDCEVGKAFLSYANRNTADYTVEDGTFFVRSYAFADSETLRNITMPESVQRVGYSVFANCIIENATIPIRLLGQLNGEQRKQLVTLSLFGDGVTEIGSSAFSGCSSLTSITIPDSVTFIGSGAFRNCTSLTSVTFGENSQLTTIGDDAFEYCTSLTSITIPDSVTSIGSGAFYNCSGLTSITIPDSVTSFGGWAFSGCSSLASITIPDSVTSIGSSAFSGCTSLTSVTIGNSVTSIGSSAFHGCAGLTSVTIPDSVTSIDYEAFRGCTGLTSITIPDSVTSIGDSAFYICSSLTSVTIGNSVTEIGSSAFESCSGLTSVTIPDSVTTIGKWAFSGCNNLQNIYITDIAAWCNIAGLENLMGYGSGNKKLYINNELATSVTIPDGVTSIPSDAFRYCTSLTSITIPDSVTTIGDDAFEYCTSLTSITIPDSVTSIGGFAFFGCDKLQDIYITDIAAWCNISGLGNLMVHASSNKKLYINNELATSITIPDGVTSISSCAFYNCTGLTSVTIPDSVTSIGSSAFYNCTGLTSVTIPDSVTSIGSSAFESCSGLTSVTIPDSVTSICQGAFYNCSKLQNIYITDIAAWCNIAGLDNLMYHGSSNKKLYINNELARSVTIPDGVTSIPSDAFRYCTGFTSVTIPDSVTNIGNSAFYECNGLTSVTIPDSVTSIGEWAFAGCTSLTSVTIPDSVTNIGWNAFSGCYNLQNIYITDIAAWCNISGLDNLMECGSNNKNLYINNELVTSVTIPDGVTSIPSYAFYRCTGLTSVTIPDSVTSIGSYAFEYCRSLTSVTFAENSQLTSIGDYAFEGCTSLTSVTIPGSVTTIGDRAFAYCTSLTNIVIPDSVTTIGKWAFGDCTSLTNVYYTGTEEQWNEILIGTNNTELTNATKHFEYVAE